MSINQERESVKRKIIALLNKTTDNGCSEHEAMIAAEKANELMIFYDIEFGDLEFEEKNIVHVEIPYKMYGKGSIISYSVVGIARLTQCKEWSNPNTRTIHFVGFKHDVEVAEHFINYLMDVFESEMGKFKTTDFYINNQNHKRSVMSNFLMGIDTRIQSRLIEMADLRKQKVNESNKTDLVPMKEFEIHNKLNEMGIRLVRGTRKSYTDYNSFKHGKEVGDSISLNNPINGENNAKRLSA